MNRAILSAMALLIFAIPVAAASGVRIEIGTTRADGLTGDTLTLQSQVTNDAATPTGPMLVYLSLVDITQGLPVDLEDWTANRSVSIPTLAAGETLAQTWTLKAIQKGDYVVYVVAMPNATTGDIPPVTSSAIYIHVTQRTNLNPGGVLPIVVGTPLLLAGALLLTRAQRSRLAKKAASK